ncbi:MAG: CDP-alcohol phosphatidyltransferase family protein [Pseudomonadota bacterium]
MARLAARLAGQGLTANGVTVTGFVIGLVAIIAISQQLFWIGLLGLMINRFCDGLDGALARQAGPTDLGGFLDIVLDFIIYAGFVFGFALADPVANGLPAAFLLFSFMGTGSSFLAFAIMAEKRQISTDIRGRKSLYYLGGLTEGTETILVLALCCVLPFWFPQIAVVFGFMCWVTTVARIFWGYQALR